MRAFGGWRPEASSTPGRLPLIVGGIVAVVALSERAMGRPLVCRCGRVRLWAGDVRSPQNSQQLLDWYSLSHLVHGLLFYAPAWLACPRWPVPARFVAALTAEAVWEVAENSPPVIARYRTATIALGDTGDSVFNSLADIGCMTAGFLVASRVSTPTALGLALLAEVAAAVAIRDGLLLNILMLLHPITAIRRWQAGA